MPLAYGTGHKLPVPAKTIRKGLGAGDFSHSLSGDLKT
jgi:hypothetical protein